MIIYLYPLKTMFGIFEALTIFILTFLGIRDDPNQYFSRFAYPCSVNNCEVCSYTNFCGSCARNFILTIDPISSQPSCNYVDCNIQNCQQCYQDNICQVCQNGFYQTSSGRCSQKYTECTVENCLSCSSSDSNTCQLCAYGYFLSDINSQCFSINGNQIENCLVAFQNSSYMCQICNEGYIINPAYQCVQHPNFNCDVSNCIQCSGNNDCALCNSGFERINGGCSPLQCNIQYCESCKNKTTCEQCVKNYALIDNKCEYFSYGCNIENCVICGQGSQICSRCESGYKVIYHSSSDDSEVILSSFCQKITQSSGDSGSIPVKNCQKFGIMPPGTSFLSIGCVECQLNFVNVGGYCVANLNISSYRCDIQNCVYCVANNVCGECQNGYTALPGSFSKCLKNYSPISNCEQTAFFAPVCAQCSPGYILSQNLTCISVKQKVSCSVAGCLYCLEENVCFQCRKGYLQNSEENICQPLCNNQNCYSCLNSTNCSICSSGYLLNQGNCVVQPKSSDCSDSELYGEGCKECSSNKCLNCKQDFTFNPETSRCCETPAQNAIGCLLYENECSNRCSLCKNGYNKLLSVTGGDLNQCISMPCTIDNCQYCPQQNKCIVCSDGYILNFEGSCETQTQNSCPSYLNYCKQCSQDKCTSCLAGYKLYEGTCVCDFQNCLKCEGNFQCTACAYPTIASLNGNSIRCLPPFIPRIQCQIPGCKECRSPNICSFCADGYQLTSSNTCSKNQCNNLPNCNLCNENEELCYQCSDGYIQNIYLFGKCEFVSNTASENCSAVIQGCGYCAQQDSGNNNVCQSCVYDYSYSEDEDQCTKNICENTCLICLNHEEQDQCFACKPNFYLSLQNEKLTCSPVNSSIDSSCFESMPYCISCFSSTQCKQCYKGFQEVDGLCKPQTCQVQNCSICTSNSSQECSQCQPGNTLTSNFLCYYMNPDIECNIFNCIQCYTNNSCGQCSVGFSQYQGVCVSDYCSDSFCKYCTNQQTCQICQDNYILTDENKCIPNCQITNCITCETLISCSDCSNNASLVNDNSQCLCKENFVLNSNNECICPQDDYSFNENNCYECSLENCGKCSDNNVCSFCLYGYILSSGKCQCPSTYTVLENGECVCSQGFKSNPELKQCIQCSEDTCKYCSEADFCQSCYLGMFPNEDGICECPTENHLQSKEGECYCPPETTPYQKQCIDCQIENCQTCSSDDFCSECSSTTFQIDGQGKCICPENTIFNEESKQCVTCQPWIVNQCSKCNSTNYCQTCQQSFINENGQCFCPTATTYSQNLDICIQCKIENCVLCEKDTGLCENCREGTYLSKGLCILCDISNCQNCDSPMYCDKCSDNLEPSSQGDKCVGCNIDNCKKCSADNLCDVCEYSYSLSSNSGLCVLCQINGCHQCVTSNVCQFCHQGYQLQKDGTCSPCLFPCSTCVVSNQTQNVLQCETCSYPFSIKPNDGGRCFPCAVLYCKECQESSEKCLECISGYNLTDNECQKIGPSMEVCVSFEGDACIKCSPGYTLNSSNQCQQCADYQNCIKCQFNNISICQQCSSGFYNKGGNCISCPFDNCQTCTQTICLTYLQTFKQFALYQHSQINPVMCDIGCKKCSTIRPTACIECSSGYTLTSQYYCLPCSYPCLQCSPDNPSECYSCLNSPTSVTDDKKCGTCPQNSNCLTCQETGNSSLTCTSCPSAFNQNQQCTSSCPIFCVSCHQSFCFQCLDGYSLSPSYKCVPCLMGCSWCAYDHLTNCLKCNVGYYLSNGACKKCQSNCQYCMPENPSVCLSCMNGYILSQNQCVIKCEFPCSTCNSNNQCTSCFAGYTYLTNSTCSLNGNFYADQNALNQYCPYSYYLQAGYCNSCQQLPNNCLRCNSQNSTRCTLCNEGYYLDLGDNQCEKCPQECQTCSNNKTCSSCSFGFTAIKQPISLPYVKCQKCLFPCKSCLNSPSSCLSCEDQYDLLGYSCIKKDNFGFKLQLDTNLSSFYQNYYLLLTQLAKSLQYNTIAPIIVTDIKQGSVNITGQISSQSESTLSYQDQYSNLQNLLKNGSTIAGFSILYSEIEMNGGTISLPNNNSGTNIGLILGIVIPITIAIFVVGFSISLKYHKKKGQIVYIADITENSDRRKSGFTIQSNIRRDLVEPKGEMEMQEII